MDFVRIERGWGRYLVLLPGWGFLGGIFSRLFLPYDYILPARHLSCDISDDLAAFFDEEGLGRTAVLGWSLGASLAVDFAERYPEKISSLILISLRSSFPAIELERKRVLIEADPKGALHSFYRGCFAGQKEDYKWFVECHEKRFIETITKEELLGGLAYLSSRTVSLDRIPCTDILIVYGMRDLIAPARLAPRRAHARYLVMPGTGHLPFLSPGFSKAMTQGP